MNKSEKEKRGKEIDDMATFLFPKTLATTNRREPLCRLCTEFRIIS